MKCINPDKKPANAKIKLVLVLFLLLALNLPAYSFTTNGTGKIFDFAITSGKNANISGSGYKIFSVIGDITSTLNSSDFKNEVGFLRTLPYLDGEPCQINLECIGSYCCSSVCQSSACPVASIAPSGGGGAAAGAAGGGGGAPEISKIESFTIDHEIIKSLIKQGATYKTQFLIKNTGNVELKFDIDYSYLKSNLLLSETQFALLPNKEKVIEVTIFASEEQAPDVYTGNIRISANGIAKSLPVIVEVQTKKALFDITTKVVPQSKNILKTENVIANITLVNVGDLKPVDAHLYYAIRDIEGNNLTFGTETLAVYNKISTIKELELPQSISFGTYIFYAKVSYGIDTASSGDVFYVVNEKQATCYDKIKNQNEEEIDCGGICKPCRIGIYASIWSFFINYLLIIFGIIITILAIILAIILFKRRKHEEIKNKSTDFIEKALSEGYKVEQIRAILLSKKYPEKIVDDIFDKMLTGKLTENRIEGKFNNGLISYMEKTLNLGYKTPQIKRALSAVGWPEAVI